MPDRILAIDHDDADFAPVLVGLPTVEDHIPVKYQVGQVLLGRLGRERLLDSVCHVAR